MPFNPAKAKQLYQNGISNYITKPIKPPKLDEWSILEPTGNLIGFIQIEKDSDLPAEIWIRDKKYILSEKISKP